MGVGEGLHGGTSLAERLFRLRLLIEQALVFLLLLGEGLLGVVQGVARGVVLAYRVVDGGVRLIAGVAQRGLLVGVLGTRQVEAVDFVLLLLGGCVDVGGAIERVTNRVTAAGSQVHGGGVAALGVGGTRDVVQLRLCLGYLGVGILEASACVHDLVLGRLGGGLAVDEVDAGLVGIFSQRAHERLHLGDLGLGARNLADEVGQEAFNGTLVVGLGDHSRRLERHSSGHCDGQHRSLTALWSWCHDRFSWCLYNWL